MLSANVLIVAGLLWLGLLFGAALWGERRPGIFARHWGVVYALSLAVYCTSWTFYGTVTQAARSGWWLPPTFVGTIVLYTLGIGLLQRLVRMAREHNATSLADLIATRLGKDSWLAAAVTAVTVVGMVPYIALQLKAVAMSHGLLTRTSSGSLPPWQDSALYVALAMAVFAMLFGTRRASAAEHNRGLVLAMAFESLLKLGAMLALGAFVAFGLDDVVTASPPPVGSADGFTPLVMLGVLAIFTLPHQFHVGVVECQDEQHLRTARWLFPLYMLLIALPILPLARAGQNHLAALAVPSDLYVLALPLSQGHDGLALLAFLGGLSAATGMVILATLALSLMIGNHWIAPVLLQRRWALRAGRDLRGAVLMQRRFAILAVLLLAWTYNRLVGGNDALADMGAVSFSALGTLAPALGFAMWRPNTPSRAVIFGMAVGFVFWFWALPLPALMEAMSATPAWLREGPFGWVWLAPDSLFGLTGWSRLGRAVALSLLFGPIATLLWAMRGRGPVRHAGRGLTKPQLRDIASRLLPGERVRALFDAGTTDAQLATAVERELSSVLGAASTRLLFDAARREAGRDLDTVVTIVGEASQALRFNQQVLEAALENMSQGISVVDRNLCLVAWNRRYVELFGFPAELVQVGRPIADLAAFAAGTVLPAGSSVQALVQRRLAHMRAGTAHLSERRFPDGSIVEIRGNPMPGGGFVATFTDVTAFRRAEDALRRANETLEQRVRERTVELEAASRAAQQANAGKSRFLAAVGHDLMQPLHAAQLFNHALAQRLRHEEYRDAVDHVRGALASTESLLAGLLDLSRLDAGGMEPQRRDFALRDVLDHLASEFGVLAAERQVRLHYRPTRHWANSDPALLRRVLQNFLSNAVRYAERGRVLLGVRRRGAALEIQVWDTGAGIAPGEHGLIFEEFRRGDDARGQGLGLGLSIAERMARLLDHPLRLDSWPGRGTLFAVRVPFAASGASDEAVWQAPTPVAATGIIVVVDNDLSVRRAMDALLSTWGFSVTSARDGAQAELLCAEHGPALLVLDYHLDSGDTGLAVWRRLCARFGAIPALVITADHSDAVGRAVTDAGLLLLHKPLKPLALRSALDRLLRATGSV